MNVEQDKLPSALTIAPVFAQFVEDELLPAIGVRPATFWAGLESIIDDLTPVNRALLEKRDEIQGLRFVYEPEKLRFFQGRFEPV